MEGAESAEKDGFWQEQQQGKETEDDEDGDARDLKGSFLLHRDVSTQGGDDARLTQDADGHQSQEHLGEMDGGEVGDDVDTHPSDAPRSEQTLHALHIDACHPRGEQQEEEHAHYAPEVALKDATDVVFITQSSHVECEI